MQRGPESPCFLLVNRRAGGVTPDGALSSPAGAKSGAAAAGATVDGRSANPVRRGRGKNQSWCVFGVPDGLPNLMQFEFS